MRALTEKVDSVFVYKTTWTEVQKARREIFQQARTYGSLRFKGIVYNVYIVYHGSTALAVLTYIGFGIKIPTNLGL